MAFDLQKFYTRLDAHYAALNIPATEQFLLQSRQAALQAGEPELVRDGCPACAPPAGPNGALVAVCNELACFYRGLSRWQESLEQFTTAQQEFEQYYQTATPQYATVLLNKAGTYRYMGQPQQALELFEKAQGILARCPDTAPGVLAGLANNTGLALLDLGRPQQAIEQFLAALPIVQADPAMIVEQGSTWNNLAAAYDRLGDAENTAKALDRAVEILSKLDCGHNPHYPAALNMRGVHAYRAGRYADALQDFEQALQITAMVYGENIEYAAGCDNCAAACRALQQTAKAEAYAARAAAIRERLGAV
ncbi:MAG: tetratricopeptide repeat protein [Faecalibacterium sp.]|nr:tetratricopeptide repeat protein [Faecalibacterium sp.]